MGYGGNDHSIVTALKELPESALQWGIYWVADIIPDNDMGTWLAERNAVWVRHLDFDSLMLNVLDEFRLTGPDPRRFLKLIDTYADTAGCLRFYPDYADWQCGASGESESKAVDELTFTNYAEVVVNLTENPLHIITMAERRRTADEQAADLIYKEGLRLYPNSSRLHVSYATFLKETSRGDDQAEKHYLSAVHLDQNDVDAHVKYAQFLAYYRDEIDEAEKIFKEVYKLAPRNVRTLSMYGDFMGRYRGNKDEAEKLFAEALEAAPDNSEVLELYAAFQYDIIENSEKAEELFTKSIQSDPRNASALARYTMLSAAEGKYHQGTFLAAQVYALTDRKDLALAIGFLQYAHLGEHARVEAALAEIKRLVRAEVRAPWLNLQKNVDKAVKDGHVSIDLLQVLSKVIANKIDPIELEKFEKWKGVE
jgi:tetratricopeptide (TPR) repeat protein